MAAVIAFTYDQYYCYGIKSSFRGIYKTENDVFASIIGGRYEFQHLEIMNIETLGFKKYRWEPEYVYTEERQEDGSKKDYLTHRWDTTIPVIEIKWDGEVRKYGHHNPVYYAGTWVLEDDPCD